MWYPDDESLFTHKREITPHSSSQHDTISFIPTTISQSSAFPIFPVVSLTSATVSMNVQLIYNTGPQSIFQCQKRAASNEFGEDVIDRKVRRLDMDGINSVISPVLGYVDLMNNEPNKVWSSSLWLNVIIECSHRYAGIIFKYRMN